MDDPIEFVFSFRSPYAWLAARHVLPLVHRDVAIRWVPFYPLESFPNFGPMVPGRIKHNLEDIVRLATTYGLPIGRPRFEDHDWPMSHAAFVWADQAGRGAAFGQALFEEHWERGESLTDERTIRRAAEKVGLDPAAAVAASVDEGLRAELADLVQKNYDERDVFGVPMFILPDGKRFWGHDRMEWAIRYDYVRAAV